MVRPVGVCLLLSHHDLYYRWIPTHYGIDKGFCDPYPALMHPPEMADLPQMLECLYRSIVCKKETVRNC